jgi:hypothetical protein
VSEMPSLPPVSRNGVLALMLSAIAALGAGIGAGAVHALQQPHQSLNRPKVQSVEFTIGQYNRLKIGMSREQVELILQPGTEESRSDTESTFKWSNSENSYIKALFQGEKLKTKEQVGIPQYPSCY